MPDYRFDNTFGLLGGGQSKICINQPDELLIGPLASPSAREQTPTPAASPQSRHSAAEVIAPSSPKHYARRSASAFRLTWKKQMPKLEQALSDLLRKNSGTL